MKDVRDATARILDHLTLGDVNRRARVRPRRASRRRGSGHRRR
jgi:hypothetical protein